MQDIVQIIPYVTNVIPLIALAFLLSYLAFVAYLEWMKHRVNTAPEADRLSVLRDYDWFLKIDPAHLTRERAYAIAMEQLKFASEKHRRWLIFLFAIFVTLSILIHNITSQGGLPETISDLKACATFIENGQNAINTQQYSKALDIYNSGLKYCPYDLNINQGVANAYYNLGKYATAIDRYNKAMSLIEKKDDEFSRKNRGFMHQYIGFSRIGLGEYKEAISEFEDARKFIGLDSESARDIWSSMSMAAIHLALNSKGEEKQKYAKMALDWIDRSLEIPPSIVYWIKYYKSCSCAILAETALTSEQKSRFSTLARDELADALSKINQSVSVRRDLHYEFMRQVLVGDIGFKSCASCPMVCPPLLAVADEKIKMWLQR